MVSLHAAFTPHVIADASTGDSRKKLSTAPIAGLIAFVAKVAPKVRSSGPKTATGPVPSLPRACGLHRLQLASGMENPAPIASQHSSRYVDECDADIVRWYL